jgi:hypothetical protein
VGRAIRNYLISLPERVLRSLTAVTAGLARELGDVTVPAAVRKTRLYQNLVDSTLRFLIEQVGEVPGTYSAEGQLAENFAIRRTAGNGIEAIGILTFRASPVWVMAALADLSGAGRHLIREISASLKQEGLLEPETNFETVDQLLDGLERTSGRVAEAINTPPLDVAGLRKEWEEIREHARSLPSPKLPRIDTLTCAWAELHSAAAAEKRTVFEFSTVMALNAVAEVPEQILWLSRATQIAVFRTGEVVASTLLDHYRATIQEIRRTGYLRYWIREFRPYLKAAATHFSPDRDPLTNRVLRRMNGD